MRRFAHGMALAAVLVPAALFGSDSQASAAAVEGGPAIVLELYTSQGCYSCPPADRLLAKLGDEASAHGRLLVPLAFHVDYWNYIGWTDPFSSKEWTARQRRYRRVLRQRSIYTPQLVIDGWRQCVGSDERTVRLEIDRAAQEASAARIDLHVADDGEGGLEVLVGAELEAAVEASSLEALVVVFQNGLVTAIPRGENASKTLENEYVVRRMERAFTLDGTAGATASGALRVALGEDWDRDHLGVAAFLQDPKSLKIYGASAVRLD